MHPTAYPADTVDGGTVDGGTVDGGTVDGGGTAPGSVAPVPPRTCRAFDSSGAVRHPAHSGRTHGRPGPSGRRSNRDGRR